MQSHFRVTFKRLQWDIAPAPAHPPPTNCSETGQQKIGPTVPLLFRYQVCGAYVFFKLLAPDEHAPHIVDALGLERVVGRTVWLG